MWNNFSLISLTYLYNFREEYYIKLYYTNYIILYKICCTRANSFGISDTSHPLRFARRSRERSTKYTLSYPSHRLQVVSSTCHRPPLEELVPFDAWSDRCQTLLLERFDEAEAHAKKKKKKRIPLRGSAKISIGAEA